MSYFDICPRCGAHLDPGETCDCQLNDEEGMSHENGAEKNNHSELQRM